MKFKGKINHNMLQKYLVIIRKLCGNCIFSAADRSSHIFPTSLLRNVYTAQLICLICLESKSTAEFLKLTVFVSDILAKFVQPNSSNIC